MQSVSGERILFGLAGFGLGALQGIISSITILCFSAFQLDFFSRLYRKIHDVKERQLDEGDILL